MVMARSIYPPMSKHDREQKEQDEMRKRRKKCRDGNPSQETCKNCSMSAQCATEGTQDWLKEKNEGSEISES